MKSLFSILSIAFLLAACSDNGSTNATPLDFNKNKVSQYSCKSALEGVVVYLNKEKIAYICNNEWWVEYNDAETLSKFENMPACNGIDKVAVGMQRTTHFTVVCHDRDWFFGDE